jgi:hypothetical protein
MVSEYIAPFRKVSDKKTIYDTKSRHSWSPKPNTPTTNYQGKPIGNTSGLNKPVIRSTARIGGSYKFPATGRPIGLQQNKVGGAIGRTTARVLADNKAWSTAVNMRIHQQNLARAAKISKGINIAGLALALGEGIYKGTKRALSPDGTQFHTGTGVPLWEDRNTENIGSKLNY